MLFFCSGFVAPDFHNEELVYISGRLPLNIPMILSGAFMRFGYYWFFRYYKRNSVVFWLAAVILGFSFHFLYKTAMMNFLFDKVKAEVLQLRSINKPYMRSTALPSFSDASSYSESDISSRIPKSCFSSDARGCVCYDQSTIVIKDFPVDRCQDIVNGFTRF